eukprot:3409342-Rhodomonas_salina.1
MRRVQLAVLSLILQTLQNMLGHGSVLAFVGMAQFCRRWLHPITSLHVTSHYITANHIPSHHFTSCHFSLHSITFMSTCQNKLLTPKRTGAIPPSVHKTPSPPGTARPQALLSPVLEGDAQLAFAKPQDEEHFKNEQARRQSRETKDAGERQRQL